jgi:hypothetical protein
MRVPYREGMCVRHCRNVEVGSLENQRTPHKGKEGFLCHDVMVWLGGFHIGVCVTSQTQKTNPGKWGYVQVHELWSPKEETHVCPGHNWLLKFEKAAGIMTCVEEFILGDRKCEEYKGRHFYGDCVQPDSWLSCE